MSPSLAVKVVIPDASLVDLSTNKVLTLFLIFTFDFGLSFLRVVTRTASSFPPKP